MSWEKADDSRRLPARALSGSYQEHRARPRLDEWKDEWGDGVGEDHRTSTRRREEADRDTTGCRALAAGQGGKSSVSHSARLQRLTKRLPGFSQTQDHGKLRIKAGVAY